MTYKQLAKSIRLQKTQTDQIKRQADADLAAQLNQCKHQKVVVVCSESRGSYSWDYDDAHEEVRQCLICGVTEFAERNQFKRLLNPVRRLELGYPYGKNSQYKDSPLNTCLGVAYKDLLAWVEKHGYTV
jgi:ferredoxin-like protein FixX